MRYPDRVLWEDEEVQAHVHPHWSTTVRPVVLLLVVVGIASFGAGAVPPGADQGTLRLAVAGVAAAVLLLAVARPLHRWGTTSYVVTSDRLLVRRGLSARRATEVDLAEVGAVTCRRSAGQRLLRSGTVLVRCDDRPAPLVLRHVPRCDRFRELLEESAHSAAADGWTDGSVDGWADDGQRGDPDPGEWATGPVTGGWGSRVG